MHMQRIIKKGSSNFRYIYPYFLIIIFVGLMLFPFLIHGDFLFGKDSLFHLNQVYDAALQIKTGHFNYFLAGYGFHGIARVVNPLYGPLWNYFCGTLLLLCGTWFRFEMLLFFITLTFGGITFYLTARALDLNRSLSLILSCVYLTTYQILVGWIGNNESDGLGTLLLPLVVFLGIKFWRTKQLHAIALGVMMAVLIQIHLLSALMAVLVLLPFFVAIFIQTLHKLTLMKQACLSLLVTLCLSGNIFGAIWDLYSSNRVVQNAPGFITPLISLRHIFFYGEHSYYGPVFASVFFVTIPLFIWLVVRHLVSPLATLLFGEAVGFIWLLTSWFPWNYLSQHVVLVRNIIQFPSRFFGPAILLLLLTFGCCLQAFLNHPVCHSAVITCGGVLLGLLVVCGLSLNVFNNYQSWLTKIYHGPRVVRSVSVRNYSPQEQRAAFHTHNLHRLFAIFTKSTADYLPTSQPLSVPAYYHGALYYELDQNESTALRKYHEQRAHHQISLRWQARRAGKKALPFVKYQHTFLRLNGRRINPRINTAGSFSVPERAGWNHLTLQYRPGLVFYLLSMLAILSWISIAVMGIRRLYHHGNGV